MKEMKEKAALMEKMAAAAAAEKAKTAVKAKTPRQTVTSYLYDRGDEVLRASYAQYPAQTESIVIKIAELIQSGEIQSRISGGELLSLFRSIGLRVRIDTSINVEQDGKMVSFAEKLKQNE